MQVARLPMGHLEGSWEGPTQYKHLKTRVATCWVSAAISSGKVMGVITLAASQ